MGDVAASGGYYIVAPATKIFANPNTITGSIGVFGVFPNMNEFLPEKIGITSDVVKTNEHADFGSVFQELDNQEQMMLREEIDRFYDSFITKVASGRGMTKERVDEIGRGHVYSGERAMEIGLIDEFGGLDAAIEEAAKQAGVEQYRIVKYPFIEDPLQKIIRQMTQNARLKILEKELGDQYYYYKKLEEIKNMKGIQTRMLYDLRVQ